MKTKLLFLFVIILSVGARHAMPLQGQELPDTVWSKNNIGNIHVVKFSPDGRYLFVGADYDILQFDVNTGELIRTLSFHRAYVTKIGFSATGDTIISSGWDGRIVLWDYQTGDTIAYISTLRDMNKAIDSDALITPDGKRIITLTGLVGLDKPQIIVIDIETKEIIKSFVGKYSQSSQLNISPDGENFYFTDFVESRGFVLLIDLNTYEEIAMFDNSPFGIMTPTIAPDNSMLASISYVDGKILIYDLNAFKLRKVINYNEPNTAEFGFGNAIFSNDSKYLIFGYYDHEGYEPNNTIVWNFDKDSVEYVFQYSEIRSIDISKDDYIATVGLTPTKGWHVNLLRPNWKITDVKENFANELKYTFNNSKLKIFFDEEIISKPEINIYNILGVGAHCPDFIGMPVQNDNEIEIDLEYLTSGVYFVVVDFAGKRNVLKILKN